jgi:acyl-CoA reductase-like NAD-dependent aldehyde dehydrogenase
MTMSDFLVTLFAIAALIVVVHNVAQSILLYRSSPPEARAETRAAVDQAFKDAETLTKKTATTLDDEMVRMLAIFAAVLLDQLDAGIEYVDDDEDGMPVEKTPEQIQEIKDAVHQALENHRNRTADWQPPTDEELRKLAETF